MCACEMISCWKNFTQSSSCLPFLTLYIPHSPPLPSPSPTLPQAEVAKKSKTDVKQNGQVTTQTVSKGVGPKKEPPPSGNGESGVREKLTRFMSEPVGATSTAPGWKAPASNKCAVCDKVVYAMEKLDVDKIIYHKVCFKCAVCKKTLR